MTTQPTNRDATAVFPDLEEKEAFSSDFDAIKISIASPERVRAWSHGEVNKAETINYRTQKPERGGLFCAQIFGPITDWECLCGKYKRMKHRGVICDKCGVEVTQASVRRNRLGHIELASPVSHVWFFKVPPSRIGQIVDLTPRELERVLYYESHTTLDPGDVGLELFKKWGELGLLDKWGLKLQREHVELLQALFPFSVDPPLSVMKEPDDGYRIRVIRKGTLDKGQVVTDEQDRLLKDMFGRSDHEFQGKCREAARRAREEFKEIQKNKEATEKAIRKLEEELSKEKQIQKEKREKIESCQKDLQAIRDREPELKHKALERRARGKELLKEIRLLKAQIKKANGAIPADLEGLEAPKTQKPREEVSGGGQSREEEKGTIQSMGEAAQLENVELETPKTLLIERQQENRELRHQESDDEKEKEKLRVRKKELQKEIRQLRKQIKESEIRCAEIKKLLKIEREAYRKLEEREKEERIWLERFENLAKSAKVYKLGMGAGAVRELLREADLEKLSVTLRAEMRDEKSILKRAKAAKRLKVVDAFRRSGNLPEWMIMDAIPVIPPDLRPLVQLDGGRYATSDLNELYRKVINRNNRLKRLQELRAPDVIVRNEQRMLQEAVDALFDNGRRGRVIKGANSRPLKSLSDTLKGKQGRFRQNLLGKRVDYSGRSVIVVGPELKLYQCGLPKKMALELFKPFLFNRLEHEGLAATIKQARELVEEQRPEVWDYLEEVIREHSVLLNRAPTLHRLGIQAFEPVLVEGKAIRIHPLVCSAFNADFDGDQMAVHVPLSPEAQAEAALLMRASRNILSPAHGGPLAVPTQDMVLGLYYLTKPQVIPPKVIKFFGSVEEVLFAKDSGSVGTLTSIDLRHDGEVLETHDSQNIIRVAPIRAHGERIRTTVGRVLLNERIQEYAKDMPFVNGVLKKRGIQSLVRYIHLRYDLEMTGKILDALKELGFEYATRSGASIGLGDLVVSPRKADMVEKAKAEVGRVDRQYDDGAITEGERYNKVIDVWTDVTNRVAEDMLESMEVREQETGRFNPVFMMVDSGARGSRRQIRQLAGMRGLMATGSGKIIETPITGNFREGLSVIQYFISTNGARKGLADTALRTADAGYLTRRLADVAQDVIVTERDCATPRGIYVEPIINAGEVIEPLRDRIVGRVSPETVKDFHSELIVDAGDEISEQTAITIEASGVQRVKVRSVLTCETVRGICAKCYGRNLATRRLVDLGEAVGIIAAQSIGEPGTQLTMRTFHIGGSESRGVSESTVEAKNDGIIRFVDLRTTEDRHGNWVVFNQKGKIEVVKEDDRVLEEHWVEYGARIKTAEGDRVTADQTIVEWDPYSFSILSEEDGVVKFEDIIEGKGGTMDEEEDTVTHRNRKVIKESSSDNIEPRIDVQKECYTLPPSSVLKVKEGQKISSNDVLAKFPKNIQSKEGGIVDVDTRQVKIRKVEKIKDFSPKDGYVLKVEKGDQIDEGDVLAKFPKDIVSKVSGTVKFPSPKEVVIVDGGKSYTLPLNFVLKVEQGSEVDRGTILAEEPESEDTLRSEEDGIVTISEDMKRIEIRGIVDRYSRTARVDVKVKKDELISPGTVLMTDPEGGVIRSETDGIVGESSEGKIVIAKKIVDRYQIPPNAKLRVKKGDKINSGTVLMTDPEGDDIRSKVDGEVLKIWHQDGVRMVRIGRSYLMSAGAHLEKEENARVHSGDVLAKIPREKTQTKDITGKIGGLPRVVELFEARQPRSPALISEIDGRLEHGDVRKGKRVIRVISQVTDDVREYEVPRGVHISVREGEEVRAGDPLMDGPRNPHDILRVLGEGELQRYLVHEVQEVYRLQGVVIDDKHIEVIISRMMRWVRVTDVGDTELIVDTIIDRNEFAQANRKAQQEGGEPAKGEPMLLGLTKASLATDSFISGASFQETTKVLTDAALNGKVDYLRGLKENVIMGRLIPAGSGLSAHSRFVLPEDIQDHRAAHRSAMRSEEEAPELAP